MQYFDTRAMDDQFFEVVAGTGRSQAAVMTLGPGESSGEAERPHDADQWLYVTEGSGLAIVEGREIALDPGSLLLIAAGERHEIRNIGHGPLRTISIYAPPEYDSAGEELR